MQEFTQWQQTFRESQEDRIPMIRARLRDFLAYQEAFLYPRSKLGIKSLQELECEWGKIFMLLKAVHSHADRNKICIYFKQCVQSKKEKSRWKVVKDSIVAHMQYFFREEYAPKCKDNVDTPWSKYRPSAGNRLKPVK